MKTLTKAILGLSALALAACTNPGQFGGGGGLDNTTTVDPVQNEASAEYFKSSIGDRVLFPVDESTLTEVGRLTLRAQANWLRANPGFAVLIEGHADEQGTREYNLALGARRASAVQQFLIAEGVTPARLKTVTFGKERPIAICSDEGCYSQNRRAVTVVTGGLG